MSTISVPLKPCQEKFIAALVASGKAANKAHAVRYAIDALCEEQAIQAALTAEREVRAGKICRGNLNEITQMNTHSKSFDFLKNEPDIYSLSDLKKRYV